MVLGGFGTGDDISSAGTIFRSWKPANDASRQNQTRTTTYQVNVVVVAVQAVNYRLRGGMRRSWTSQEPT